MSILLWAWQGVVGQLSTSLAWQSFAALMVLFLVLVAIEWKLEGHLSRYLEASFLTDIVYTVLIIGGVYAWIQQPVVSFLDQALRQHTPFLYMDLLRRLPEPIQLALFLLAVDFCRYWKHRALHVVPGLREVHSIHHSAENLNFLTAFRVHLLEYVIDGVITLLPAVLLGLPPEMWLPLYLSFILLNAIQHSDLDLSFGRLNRIFVSPRFHAVHHSDRRSHYDSNFGALFSFWDVLFGTAIFAAGRPARYGLPKLNIPGSFIGQLIFPVSSVLRRALRARSGSA
ncbi:sterol desaturase family protein [Bradyrhizobium manausense]|uniref:sterol desaturase family protein n=1 Tax=Bradyrhizobium TaxID=374 RepID=UPI001BAE40EC|nr:MULTISPECIES: sterol desaturase family protein [Bradyrhizobium]MBR0828009.1 sterol desaturase family protein [Bradyrhizobium manausense]UVO32872.1 sterol desaturase family protein [Bradyrhizobium arachidis]